MKKLIFPIVCCFISITVSAQLVKQEAETQKKQSELDWFNCSFDKDSVYGAEVNKAYEYLKANKKKAKKRPVVALIGTGMDVEHEDLKHAIWMNPKEKLNQKDDDKNGLVDDINGWNFIGGKDGQVMEALTREGEREFFRLKDKYADYIFDGKKYYKIVNGKRQEVPVPENMEEYNYYRYKVMPESRIGGTYGGLQLSYVIEEYVEKFDKDMKKRFPGKELTVEDFQSCYDPKAERDSLSEVAFVFTAYYFSIYNTDKWEPVYQNMGKKSVATAKTSYEDALKKYGTDNRKEIVGDNPLDINDTQYGNNVLLTSDAATGVMKAGVIAAKRDNGVGSNGIADNAEIMTLRIHPGEGEPYLKDMALAIRYAVNHGADIILLPEQNSLYPEEQRQWVADALKEAEKKGALVIVPVWDLSVDMDKDEFFPNRKMRKDGELTNFMVVASSDKNGNPVDIRPYDRNVATKLIEDFMLAANETVAAEYYWRELPFVYRTHEQPDSEKIQKLSMFINNFGYSLHIGSDEVHPKELQKLLEKIDGTSEEPLISRLTLRSMKQARYTVENTGHFGLAADCYCHFTSPIRRYPDLQIHRIIKDSLRGRLGEKRIGHYTQILPEIAKHASEMERRADEAERETIKLKKVQYMENHIGETFAGVISGVAEYGFFVELENTVEGLVRVTSLTDDFYQYYEETYELVGEATNRRFKLGQQVRVTVDNCDRIMRTIDFTLADSDEN